jgi:hypothetical protein
MRDRRGMIRLGMRENVHRPVVQIGLQPAGRNWRRVGSLRRFMLGGSAAVLGTRAAIVLTPESMWPRIFLGVLSSQM